MFFQLDKAKINYEYQGTVYVEEPKKLPEKSTRRALIAVHGSNRGAIDYLKNDFYSRQREIALENGYVFAVISNNGDTWGTDDGLYNINLLADKLYRDFGVERKVALWATSAGGITAYRMVREHPEKVEKVIGTFPVYDLWSGFKLNSCKSAWKTNDPNIFAQYIKNINPAFFPEALKCCNFYLTHGTNDTAVPLEENSLKMVSDIGKNVFLEIIEGGIHSTTNFDFYGNAVKKAFEKLCQ